MNDRGRLDGGPVTSFVVLCFALPCQARLDALALHHVTVRGIERCALFRHDGDQADLIAGLAHLPEPGASIVDAKPCSRSPHPPAILRGSLGAFPSGIANAATRAEQGEVHWVTNIALRRAACQLCGLAYCFSKRSLIITRRTGSGAAHVRRESPRLARASASVS